MDNRNIVKKPNSFGKSCQGAWKGIIYSLKAESHLRFHFFAAVVVTALGFYVGITRQEWLFLTYAIGSVLVAELFNTSLERVVDLVRPGFNILAGTAKDIAAGAVLLTALQSIIIGIIIFGPYLF